MYELILYANNNLFAEGYFICDDFIEVQKIMGSNSYLSARVYRYKQSKVKWCRCYKKKDNNVYRIL